MAELVAVMDRLRSPGGCPWDAEQTHRSLLPYLIEEAYETVEVIEAGDRAGMREEFGDLLLQVVFHARIAAEDPHDPWTLQDVAAGITAKIVSRHPHVFGDVTADTAAEVEANWAAIKAVEKSRESVLDGLPAGMPALMLATAMTRRAHSGGVSVEVAPPTARAAAVAALDRVGASEAGLGELLLALADLARDQGLDPEAGLRAALRDYGQRVRAAERA